MVRTLHRPLLYLSSVVSLAVGRGPEVAEAILVAVAAAIKTNSLLCCHCCIGHALFCTRVGPGSCTGIRFLPPLLKPLRGGADAAIEVEPLLCCFCCICHVLYHHTVCPSLFLNPAVEWGQEVALVGAAESLGAWDVEKSIPMSWNDGDFWTAQAELPTE